MTINYEEYVAVNQSNSANETISANVHHFNTSVAGTEVPDISIHTRLLVIAAAFVMVLALVPWPI